MFCLQSSTKPILCRKLRYFAMYLILRNVISTLGRRLTQAGILQRHQNKMPSIFSLSPGVGCHWQLWRRNSKGCWRRRHTGFVSLMLHSSFPKKGLSFLLHLKAMWLNPFFGRWEPPREINDPLLPLLYLVEKVFEQEMSLDTKFCSWILAGRLLLLTAAGKKLFWYILFLFIALSP